MFKYGLKLWSTNTGYIPSAAALFKADVFQYLELFSVPDSFSNSHVWAELQKSTNVQVVIHAPHYMTGMNLADPSCVAKNRSLAGEAFRFADLLRAEKIIFHSGVNGSEEETARQLRGIYDPRMLVENKPYIGIVDGLLCVGHSPAGVRQIMEGSGTGFCMDIGHAIAAANALKQSPEEWTNQFLQLEPAMFHLADGDRAGSIDQHLHLGEGSYDLPGIISRIPRKAMITLETVKKYTDKLDDCEADVRFLNALSR